MGTIKRHAIVVSYWNENEVRDAHEKAVQIFISKKYAFRPLESLISPIINGVANSDVSFFIAPDGSKEGWEASNLCNDARNEFLDWMVKNSSCDYVEVIFGGDYDHDEVLRTKHIDLIKLSEEDR